MKASSGSHQIMEGNHDGFDCGWRESMMAPFTRNGILRKKGLSSEPPVRDINSEGHQRRRRGTCNNSILRQRRSKIRRGLKLNLEILGYSSFTRNGSILWLLLGFTRLFNRLFIHSLRLFQSVVVVRNFPHHV